MSGEEDYHDVLTHAMMRQAQNAERNGDVLLSRYYYNRFVNNLRSVAMRRSKSNPNMGAHLLTHVSEYVNHMQEMMSQMDRSMAMATLVTKNTYAMNGVSRTRSGCTYQRMFDEYFDEGVKEMIIEYPCLPQKGHFKNLIKFLELPNRKCPQLRYIGLLTKMSPRYCCNQNYAFRNIRQTLAKHNVIFDVNFSDLAKNQRIYLNTGYLVRVEGNLGLFDPVPPNELPTQAAVAESGTENSENVNNWFTEVAIWKCPSAAQ